MLVASGRTCSVDAYVADPPGACCTQMTTTKFKSLPLKPTDGKPLQVPFDFFPEFKPQQLGVEFRMTVNDAVSGNVDRSCKALQLAPETVFSPQQTGKKHNIHAYTGTVTVVEPKKSWFDPQLLSLYALLAGIVGTAIYWASKNFPGSKTISKRKERQAGIKSTPKAATTGTKGQTIPTPTASTSAYDESWIPEHHLKREGASSPRARAGRTASSRK